jgi:hypothetical protein
MNLDIIREDKSILTERYEGKDRDSKLLVNYRTNLPLQLLVTMRADEGNLLLDSRLIS